MDRYHRPTTLQEAWLLLAATPGARFVAGGTDMMVRRKRAELTRVPALISLRSLPELAGIDADPDAVRIGAGVPLAEVARHPAVLDTLPALASAIRRLGTPQIRNVATIGGNLGNASPCADTAPPLLVYDATVEVAGPHSDSPAPGSSDRLVPGGRYKRRTVPLCDLFRGPGTTCLADDEIITAVTVPRPAPGFRAACLGQGRVATDLSLASLALGVATDGTICSRARVAAGAVGPTPLRLREVEALLEGADLTDRDLVARARAAACAEVLPITDVRATAEYRRHLIGVFFERALAEVVA